jgi:hypothetical protein
LRLAIQQSCPKNEFKRYSLVKTIGVWHQSERHHKERSDPCISTDPLATTNSSGAAPMSFFHSTQANATPTASAARSAHPAKVQHSHRQHGQHPSAAHQNHSTPCHPKKQKAWSPRLLNRNAEQNNLSILRSTGAPDSSV